MRLPRIKIQTTSTTYHCMSRIVGGQALLTPPEREHLRQLLWRQARFCGVQVLTYAILNNHFHVYLRVPPPGELSDPILLQRVEGFYGPRHPEALRLREEFEQQGHLTERSRQRLRARMGDISVYMKELKQHFSRGYNARHERYGTLWAERFRSVVVEDQPGAVRTVAGYIDLNPVRAGVVADPKDYRWCGYAEAVAGGQEARAGIQSFHGSADWAEVAAEYRRALLLGAGTAGRSGKVVLEREEILGQLARGTRLSVGQVLRLRVRYFRDGVVLGSADYVNEVFARYRKRFGARRKTGARKLRGLGLDTLRVLRDLRVSVIK
jgi:REP element-mobilizing transposase RayT